jgi:hypothetical protein
MEFSELTEVKFKALRVSWMKMIPAEDHEVYGAEYRQLFDRIQVGKSWGPLGDRVNEAIFYLIESKDSHYGVVEIVQSKKGRETWIKMFDITMAPNIETEPDTEKCTKLRLEVFKATLNGIFKLSKTVKKANTLKVYGRTELLITFLRGMHDAMSVLATLGMMKGISVSIEGRWLVFKAD